MPQYYPVVIRSGQSVMGASLGFHAYSLRIDNLTNQWLLEESSTAWIPPYSLGTCLRLYGTSVALIVNQAPVGQPQLTPITGEEAIGVYSDQYRTEVGGQAVRQFTLVQSVSDLTEGAQPALPPVAVDRLWADNQGNIHHLHSDGTDLTLIDRSNVQLIQTQIQTYAWTVPSPQIFTVQNGAQAISPQWSINNGSYTFLKADQLVVHAGRSAIGDDGTQLNIYTAGILRVRNNADTDYNGIQCNDIVTQRSDGTGAIFLGTGGNHYLYWNGTTYILPTGPLQTQALNATTVNAASNLYYFNTNSGIFWQWDGTFLHASHSVNTNGAGYYFNNGAESMLWDGSVIRFNQSIAATPNVNAATALVVNTYGQSWTGPGGAVMGASWAVNAPGGYTQTSSEKVKEQITVVDSDWWESLFQQPELRGLRYKRIDTPELEGEVWEYGMSAEAWDPHAPELVQHHYETGEPIGLRYNQIIPILWEAVRVLYNDRLQKPAA